MMNRPAEERQGCRALGKRRYSEGGKRRYAVRVRLYNSLVLRHLPCNERQSLRASSRISLLEPIHANCFLLTHGLSTGDDGGPKYLTDSMGMPPLPRLSPPNNTETPVAAQPDAYERSIVLSRIYKMRYTHWRRSGCQGL